MSIIKSIKFKKNLTPKQREFLLNKEIQGNFTLQKLLKILNKSAQYDKINDKARRSAVTFMILSLIVGIFLSIVIQSIIPFLLGAVLFVILIVYSNNLKKEDLDNSLREFTVPLLGILSGDIKPGSNLKIALCCSYPMLPKFRYDVKPRSTKYGRTISFFRYPWLSVKADIVDGSRITIENLDELQKIDIKKRSASGKIKYKTKYKRTSVISILAEFPKGFVVHNTDNPQLRISHTENGIAVKSKIKIKNAGIKSPLQLNPYVRNIQQIFAAVIPTQTA